MLAIFGTISNLMATPPETIRARLNASTDVVEAILAVTQLASISCREQMVSEKVAVADERFRRFLISELRNPHEERLLAVFLDHEKRFIHDEQMAAGNRCGLNIRVRPIIHRTLELGASSIIIAHNHPSGNPAPSQQDITATQRLRDVAQVLEIGLVDHCIVAGTRVFSMAENKLF